MNEERKPPNFAPWDRGQFLDRLGTFRHVDKWMSKPEQISEVQWAKRGWSCVGKERVGCVGGCGREVVIKLEDEVRDVPEDPTTEESDQQRDEDDWREKAQEQLVEKYAEMIATEHEGSCLWRRKGCDGKTTTPLSSPDSDEIADTIYRLPLANHATALNNLRERYHSLAAMATDLPSTISTPPNFTFPPDSPRLLNLLNPPHPSPPTSPSHTTPSTPPPRPPPTLLSSQPPINRPALTLALFGWRAETDHIPGLATCPACFRRLGLWLFKGPSPSTSSLPSAAPMTRLDPLAEHRDYCPWASALSQHGAHPSATNPLTGKAGWEILSGAVANALRPRLDAGVNMEGGREGSQGPPDTPATLQGSVVSSVETATAVDAASREEKDRERWARLKRIRQVFRVRRPKGKGKEKGKEGEGKGVVEVVGKAALRV